MGTSALSGKEWWRANQGRFPNSRDVANLEPGFRDRVERFIAALRSADATVSVSSTRRDATRAFLMHYSWNVAHGDTAPADVPARSGLDIQWDHGDDAISRQAAREMVNLFNMAHNAALNSNHIRGKAIDMDIRWSGELVLRRPAPLLVRISSTPRSGQNRELHQLGSDVFGVHKLASDPPHWSFNGK